MLQNLHVKNLALIDEAEVDFTDGFNVLTGETGAGKSLMIGALNLALGERAPKDLLKEGKEAVVELVFSVGKETEGLLLQKDLTPEDGQIILTRKLSSAKSTARINGETVPLSRLRDAAEALIQIHGQEEHQILRHKKMHLVLLDRYRKEETAELLAAYEETYRKRKEKEKEYSSTDLEEDQRKRETDLLSYEVKEIEDAHLQIGEDETLSEELKRLTNADRIREAISSAGNCITEGDTSALELVGRAYRELLPAAELSPDLGGLCDSLSEIESLLSDVSRELSSLQDADENEEEELTRLTRRSDLLHSFKQKYAPDIPGILKALEEKKERLSALRHLEETRERLSAELLSLQEEENRLSSLLTEKRTEAAASLDREMEEALRDLNFPSVRFETEITALPQNGPDGRDDVQFLISMNPGEPLLPLQKTASGGELSRIMLALSAVVKEDHIGSFVFDEIDTGISGRTAQAVSEKLISIASEAQVICITHLPQIAAMADSHFLIEKETDTGSAISRIRPLEGDERSEELARMLGGVSITDAVRQNAKEMLSLAEQKKREYRS